MTENVYLFVPNLIGYVRIVLALVSFYYMPYDYVKATFCYLLSAFLDEFDGLAARMLGQCSTFGAMLDQLTDRAATMCLLVVLSHFYPQYMFFFQVSMCIDIVSHWLHTHSSLMKGSDSHKNIDPSGNFILRHYYTNRTFLSVLCYGNELFYSMLYAAYWTPGPIIPVLGVGLWNLLAWVNAPVAIIKAGISLVHLWAASQDIVSIDMAERQAAASDKEGQKQD